MANRVALRNRWQGGFRPWRNRMKQGMKIIGGVLLAAALSSPAWAKHGKPGGPPESMAGGLPALEEQNEAGDEDHWGRAARGRAQFAGVGEAWQTGWPSGIDGRWASGLGGSE